MSKSKPTFDSNRAWNSFCLGVFRAKIGFISFEKTDVNREGMDGDEWMCGVSRMFVLFSSKVFYARACCVDHNHNHNQ